MTDMRTAADLPDLPFLHRVREELWRGRGSGRAAVMVGAGFSRNADPMGLRTPPFPLWQDFARSLYDELYPAVAGEEPEAREQRARLASANGGMLRLALEYEAAFGRGALDDAVERAIPDALYRPGELHRMLLSLPWADVFTTNYDTLLERAAIDVFGRRYEVVINEEDLPVRSRPRIFKLHGSMPIRRPYIITEEDYRTYPVRHAPFVNTVLQSLLENALVLVGFSGDDPNFLQWIGWVRDRLRHAAKPVYLCGLLNLTPARRLVLTKLNVAPIDLAPLFPSAVYGGEPNARHRAALRWLLMSLANGAPPDVLAWPSPPDQAADDTMDPHPLSRPIVLEQDPRRPAPIVRIGTADLEGTEDAQRTSDHRAVAAAWRRKRLAYPGWVILPERRRTDLRFSTEEWFRSVKSGVHNLERPVALALVREFIWRLDRVGTPLDVDWAKELDTLLGDTPLPEGASGLDEPYIRECWVEIAFALVRRGRQDGDSHFERWSSALDTIVSERSEWKARLQYERCLHHLGRLDRQLVEQCMADWPMCDVDPFWDTRRAALLAEIGKVEEARQLAASALDRLRRQLHANEDDVAILSREGWTLLVLGTMAELGESRPGSDRWGELARYRCDPWPEFHALRDSVERVKPRRLGRRTTRIDPFRGVQRTSYKLFGGGLDTEAAFSLLSLAEDAGLPLRVDHTDVYATAAARAAALVAPVAPEWAQSMILRTISSERASNWFDSLRVATMPLPEVQRVVLQLTSALDNAVKSRPDGPAENYYLASLFEGVPEVIARLVSRLSSEEVAVLIERVMHWVASPLVVDHVRVYSAWSELLRELLAAASAEIWSKFLVQLLSFPFPAPVDEHFAREWPEPFFSTPPAGVPSPPNAAAISSEVHRLLGCAEHADETTRTRALLRLSALFWLGILSEADATRLGAVLWSRTDPSTGLPAEANFYAFAYLDLPEPKPGCAKHAVRSYLLSQEFGRAVGGEPGGGGFGFGGRGGASLAFEWLGTAEARDPDEASPPRSLRWSEGDVGILLDKIRKWWELQRAWLVAVDADEMVVDAVRKEYKAIPLLLRRIVLPAAGANAKMLNACVHLLEELAAANIAQRSAMVAAMAFAPDMAADVADSIRLGMRAYDAESVIDAADAVYRWHAGAARGCVSEPPPDLLAALISLVSTCSPLVQQKVLMAVTRIVQFVPNVLTEVARMHLVQAVERLRVETRLPNEFDRQVGEPGDAEYDRMLLLPHLRVAAAQLAAALVSLLTTEPTGVLLQWQEEARADSFPRVRRAFEVIASS